MRRTGPTASLSFASPGNTGTFRFSSPDENVNNSNTNPNSSTAKSTYGSGNGNGFDNSNRKVSAFGGCPPSAPPAPSSNDNSKSDALKPNRFGYRGYTAKETAAKSSFGAPAASPSRLGLQTQQDGAREQAQQEISHQQAADVGTPGRGAGSTLLRGKQPPSSPGVATERISLKEDVGTIPDNVNRDLFDGKSASGKNSSDNTGSINSKADNHADEGIKSPHANEGNRLAMLHQTAGNHMSAASPGSVGSGELSPVPNMEMHELHPA